MRICRSSIFSFRTLDLESLPRGWLFSLVAAAAIIGAAEICARILANPIGDHVWAYWDQQAMHKFEWYRQRAVGDQALSVLVIGDSLGARNFDPVSFADSSGVNADSVFNLAWPANFPRALDVNTLPLLERGRPPDTVFLFLSPWSFADLPSVVRFEQPVVAGIIGKRHRGEFVVADMLYLNRLYRIRHFLIDYWLRKKSFRPAPKLHGFMPVIPGPNDSLVAKEFKVSPSVPEFTRERRSVVLRLVALSQERGFRVIAVVGPFAVTNTHPVVSAHLDWLESIERQSRGMFEVWDVRNSGAVNETDFMDDVHLWQVGAVKLSRWLGKRYKSNIEPTHLKPAPNLAD